MNEGEAALTLSLSPSPWERGRLNNRHSQDSLSQGERAGVRGDAPGSLRHPALS